jgi:lipopolysaccharide export system protein LptA
MPLPIYRLRRWLAVIAVLFIAMVTGTYFYARMRLRNVLKEIPNKIGIDIQQTANGFQFSKSDGKRTLFTVQAGKLKQFKLDGSAELHDVSIVLYGRDSSRFDQIYGDNFTYDKKSGDVTASGEVQIDLEANPAGHTGPDQGTPKELKNPIHLNTKDLVFNQNSGDASTNARVDFRTPQATGWAVGVQYSGKSNTLTLVSQVHVTLDGPNAATLFATNGVFTRTPHVVVLDHARMVRAGGTLQAEQATFFLGPDNQVQRVLAIGNVNAESTSQDSDQLRARADQADLLLVGGLAGEQNIDAQKADEQEIDEKKIGEKKIDQKKLDAKKPGKQNLLRTATLTGNVHVERIGSQPMQGDAGRAILDFLGRNQLEKVHAMDGVRLAQHQTGTNAAATGSSEHAAQSQDFDITAPIIDFFVAEGRRLTRAETSGAAQITITPAQPPTPVTAQSAQKTVITAGRFDAKFAATLKGSSRLTSVHGAPDAKIVNIAPGMPDRVSTSQTLDAAFLAEGGIGSIVQQGTVAYTDNQPADKRTQAWADKARYTPGDRILMLTGSPRVAEGGMVTTAKTVRINRATDDAFADGDVKSTYSDLKEQPGGALLASSSPIHVTAATMTAHNSPAIALYQGNARLWQDANIVEAPSIQFDRDRRFLIAQGTAAQPVSTVLVQQKLDQQKLDQQKLDPQESAQQKLPQPAPKTSGKTEEKPSQTSPIAISAARLTYADSDRHAHYEGGVVAKGTGFTATSSIMDAYFVPRSQTSSSQSLTGPGQLDHMVARTNVIVLQPTRRAEGQTLVYTASDDKFVLTGGPPSIFDAERGKVTGVSLTFFRGDDRVLVEGEASTPVVTQTRVVK